jgi:hypothetical protein
MLYSSCFLEELFGLLSRSYLYYGRGDLGANRRYILYIDFLLLKVFGLEVGSELLTRRVERYISKDNQVLALIFLF